MATGRGRDTRRIKCLIVDDNRMMARALQAFLASEGAQVVGVAHTGSDALRLLKEREVAVIVLDINLPDMSGLDVARIAAKASSTPIIFYTSNASAKLVREALATGARAVVLKDAPPVNLVDALDAVTGGAIYVDPKLRRPRTTPRTE